MRTTTTLAVATTVLCANAFTLSKRTDGSAPRVVQHEIQRRHVQNPVQRDQARMRRRDTKTVGVSLANEETLYFMNMTIGTPAQDLRLHIDTGSSDLWVNTATSTECTASGDLCSSSGTYSANSSSTYEYVNSEFNITYVDGTGSTGDYVTDDVTFGGITLKNQQFGIGYTSSSAEGVLGIGYALNEVAVAYTNGATYNNVPKSLVADDVINVNAYSLWLNDLDASTGSILFGGVNTDKYTGELQSVPVITEEGEYAEFIIALTAVGVNGTVGSLAKDVAYAALLDSGTSLMYLPNDITQQIYDSVGATYDSSQGAAFVDCDLANNDDYTIDFTFSSPTISVGMNELVIVAGTDKGEEVCILGISPAGDSTPVLGDTFLRSAYVVYDLENNEIGLASTNFNSTASNIVEFTVGSGIPDATTVTSAVTAISVSTGNAAITDQATGVTSTAYAMPTAAVGYNVALLGAVGAGLAFAM